MGSTRIHTLLELPSTATPTDRYQGEVPIFQARCNFLRLSIDRGRLVSQTMPLQSGPLELVQDPANMNGD